MSKVLKGWQVGHCGWRGVYGEWVTGDKVGMAEGACVRWTAMQHSEQRHALLQKNRLAPIGSWGGEIEAEAVALIQTRGDVDSGHSNSDGLRK